MTAEDKKDIKDKYANQCSWYKMSLLKLRPHGIRHVKIHLASQCNKIRLISPPLYVFLTRSIPQHVKLAVSPWWTCLKCRDTLEMLETLNLSIQHNWSQLCPLVWLPLYKLGDNCCPRVGAFLEINLTPLLRILLNLVSHLRMGRCLLLTLTISRYWALYVVMKVKGCLWSFCVFFLCP